MSSNTGQPRVWSLWIYDRHCTLVYHADWSAFHARLSAGTNALATANGKDGGPSRSGGGGGTATLPLAEQAKLVYGLVFSLRNMARKLTPLQSTENECRTSNTDETLHSFSTSTYTLAHLQTPTKYTFVMLTDPVMPPTRRAPAPGGGTSSATFSGGGGIPATGGMTTTGVLQQISRGPWVEFVARNAGCLSLERQGVGSDEEDEEGDSDDSPEQIAARQEKRRDSRQKEIHRQRLTGLGKSVDSEAFRAAVERVLGQNKLNAPRM